MRFFSNIARVLIPAAAIHTAAACSGCADEGADLRAPAGSTPPLGVAAQGLTGSTWITVTCADFNLDGLSDVLWFDTANQLIMIWLMNGTRPLAMGPALAGPPGEGWEATNALDFNFDGMADVFWRNSKKNLFTTWLMKGTQLLAAGPAIAGPGVGWIASTQGDLNGDGMSDLVWYNAEKNAVTVWLMNGTRVMTPGPIVP